MRLEHYRKLYEGAQRRELENLSKVDLIDNLLLLYSIKDWKLIQKREDNRSEEE